MSINYHRLNLVGSPLIHNDLTLYTQNEYNFFEDLDNFLAPGLLEQFKRIGLIPNLAIVFSLNYSSRSEEDSSRFVHSDQTWHNGNWKNVPFGVNWELNSDVSSTVSWYDVNGCTQHLPPADHVHPYAHLGGIFYQGSPRVIEQVTIDSKQDFSPILFNTSVPHAVSFATSASYRCGLSVRFGLDQIATWDSAVKKFECLIHKQ
jgi:hypothetical protein